MRGLLRAVGVVERNKISILKSTGALQIALLALLLLPSHGSHLPESYLRERRESQSQLGDETVVFEPITSASDEVTELGNVNVNDIERTTYIPFEESEESTSTASSSTKSSTETTSKSPSTERITAKVESADGKGRIGDVSSSVKNSNSEVKVSSDGKRYSEISATCDSSVMTIQSKFLGPFRGRIYAVGYPDEVECGINAFSSPGENVNFRLPLGQCGVQMLASDPELESPKRHELTLYIQYSSFLQQVVDDKVSVSCVEVPVSGIQESQQIVNQAPSFRQGRRMGKPTITSKSTQTQKISSKIGESWMEILVGKDPSPKSRKSMPVSVGQDVTLVISTKVMRGYDARIVNCSANDGSKLGTIEGYRSQQILDSAGCSVDTLLVPNFRRRRLPIESRNRVITLHFATFPAFKFPERDHLHVKCQVAYCQGPCPLDPCDSPGNHFGTWREKYGRVADALVDTTEIVNSIEVYAPELDGDNGGHHFEPHQSLLPMSSSSGQGRQLRFSADPKYPKDEESSWYSKNPSSGNSVCVSPGSVIMALVVLGVVLVISATATLWFALKRSESRKYKQAVKHTPFQHAGPHQPYYRFSHW